jgi:hypothetical protein
MKRVSSHEFEFAQRVYGELNRNLLGPPSDDKILILIDSDEENEEVHEEETTGTEYVVASTTINPASTASVGVDDAPTGAKLIIAMIRGPSRRLAATAPAETMQACPRLPR